MHKMVRSFLLTAAIAAPGSAVFADTISPISYTDTLGVGESVTITKTVTIEESVSTGIVDVMFLIDTSGSMGAEIAAAKAAADDILSGLSGFGSLATGVGYYSEPGSIGVYHDLTTDAVQGSTDINTITLGLGGYGGDFPEEGINATLEAAEGASWRPGSTRFIIALGDANFKESDGSTLAATQTALADDDITFIGIDFGTGSYKMDSAVAGGINPGVLADATGGSIVSSTTSTADLIDSILAAVTDSFSTYDEVTVGDLGAGLPGVGVSVACVSADSGVCDGDAAKGDYDRSESRTFEFEVTFTGLEEGVHDFDTLALVDGGSVAAEHDTITVAGDSASVPEPGSLAIMSLGLLGFGFARRQKKA